MPRRWVEGRVDVFLDELAKYDLRLPRDAVADLVMDGVRRAAEAIGVSETTARKYATDESLRYQARVAAGVEVGADLDLEPEPEQTSANVVSLQAVKRRRMEERKRHPSS